MADLQQPSAEELAAHQAALAGTVASAPAAAADVAAAIAPPVVEVRGLIRNPPRVAPAVR